MELTEQTGADTATNVLVETPTFVPHGWEVCADLLSTSQPERTDLLFVTLNTPPSVCLDQWEAHNQGERPANVAFVTPHEEGDVSSSGERRLPDGCTVETVSSAGDLTELGTRISTVLDGWDGPDEQPVLCFRGLSILLQYREVDPTARFLHAVATRVERIGGRAHYHIDPEAHEAATLETFRSLLDDRVRSADAETDGE